MEFSKESDWASMQEIAEQVNVQCKCMPEFKPDHTITGKGITGWSIPAKP